MSRPPEGPARASEPPRPFFAAPFKLQDADDALSASQATTSVIRPNASRLGGTTSWTTPAATTSAHVGVQWRSSSVPALHAMSNKQRGKQPSVNSQSEMSKRVKLTPKSALHDSLTRQQELEQSHKAARLASTLRLKAAWSDIAYRHSHTATGPLQLQRLRRGTTRALLEDDDDIVDLETMEIVQDRGVLRNARQGAFQIGGLDERSGSDDQRSSSGGAGVGDGNGSDRHSGQTRHRQRFDSGDDWISADEDDNDDDESEDELAAIDELPSLPSVAYRAQRMEAEERRLDLLEFTRLETEARAIRASTGALGSNNDHVDDAEWERTARALESSVGNEVLSPTQLAPVAEQDEDDELAAFEVTPTASKAAQSKAPLFNNQTAPPSTLQSLRRRFGSVELDKTSPTDRPSRMLRSQSVIIVDEPPRPALPPSRSMPTLSKETSRRSIRAETPLEFKRHSFKLDLVVPISRGTTPMLSHRLERSTSRRPAAAAAAKYPTPPAQPASSSPLKRAHRLASIMSESEDELDALKGSRTVETRSASVVQPSAAAGLATPPNSKASARDSDKDQGHESSSPTKRRRSASTVSKRAHIVPLATPPVSRKSEPDQLETTADENGDERDDADELLLEPVDTPIKLEAGTIERLWPADGQMDTGSARASDDAKPSIAGEVQRRRSTRASSVLHLLPSPLKPSFKLSLALVALDESDDELDLFSCT
ncbi:hypothetical protein ACM66B_001832 [Microbotryomycetes sp. NB124-2]